MQTVEDSDKIDICVISETHFTGETSIRIKRYTVYLTIHPDSAAKGGSGIKL